MPNQSANTSMPLKPAILEMAQLLNYLPIGETNIRDLIKAGKFPKPCQISPRRVGWRTNDVDRWVDSLQPSDLPPPPNTGAPKPRNRAK